MAHLCEVCEKTFGLSGKELQEFLRPYAVAKKEAEPLDQEVNGAGLGSKNLAVSQDCPIESGITSNNSEDSDQGSQAGHSVGKQPSPKRSRRSSSSPSPKSHDHECCQESCPEVHCVACLGLLETQYSQHLARVITEHVEKCSMVGMETYSLAIHIPISLSIRRIGMEMSAKKCNPNPSSGTESSNCNHASGSNYIKEELKWHLRKILDHSLSPLRCNYESPLIINLSLNHPSSLRDCIGLKKLHPKLFPRPKKYRNARKRYQPTPITHLPVQRALEDVTEVDMVKEGYFLSPITAPCSHKVELQHRSVFVAGRYNKYSRHLPQTPWMVDGVRKAETSVQELVCPRIVEAFRASDMKFSSSGREDVDVLMLGNGRPFLLELLNPMNVSVSHSDLQGIESDINSGTDSVAVNQLRRVSKNSSSLLKQGEEEKKKTYSALVWTKVEVTADRLSVLDQRKDLVIQQRTPIRVLHRRTLAVREKTIYSMQTELLTPHHFRLTLVTQAGTYIKEFVHGDFGRTQPNVGTLLECDSDILSLDVLSVQLEWPPAE